MNLTLPHSLLAVACLIAMGNAFGDCAADYNTLDTKRSYAEGQQFERTGNPRSALAKYVVAQSYTCETNPVEIDAAKHAAALSLPLGAAAEKKGDLQAAFDFYDAGGHYAAADRALMGLLRANPDDPAFFSKAREILENRALPAFASNNEIRLGAAGAYRPDPKDLAALLAMPATGVQRALQKEAGIVSDAYLRETVQLVQLIPDDPTDTAAMQKAMQAQQAIMQKYTTDPLKESRATLDLVHRWSAVTTDATLSQKFVSQLAERREQRASSLAQKYSGAPPLLQAAIDYYGGEGSEQSVMAARVPLIRAQALRLGDAAMAGKRYTLAASYYEVADADAKADAAREEQRRMAMNKMQPAVDQMKKQAEALRKEYSDPAKIQAMREQAQAAQARLKQQQQDNARTGAKRADELEKELGL